MRALAAAVLAIICLNGNADAANPKALILGSTITPGVGPCTTGTGSFEECEAIADGFDVTVVDDATWSAMTAAQFAQYQVLIIGDPTCGDTVDGVAGANASIWQPVVMSRGGGNRVIIGTDPVFHARFGGGNAMAGAPQLIKNGIAFAGAVAGATGAYVDISCSSTFTSSGTPFSFLDGLTTHPAGEFTTQDPPCEGNISVVAQSGPTNGLHDSDLSGWSCSVHQSFPTWPSDFTPLAIATDAVIQPYCANDVDTGSLACGEPYVLISGGGVVITSNISLAPPTATNLVGGSHTVTATITTSVGAPVVGKTVTFLVESGPNVGKTGTGVTDSNGQTTFTYTDDGGAGTDTISASFVNDSSATEKATATKEWTTACGPSVTCDDGNVCTDDSCDPANGCVHTAVSGRACSDGNVCTQNDQCDASGTCVAGPPAPTSTACDDGVFCNGADTCDGAGSCTGHGGDPCPSGLECANVCNEAARNCFVATGTSCTDDSNVCTDDQCDGAGTCAHLNNSVPCDDGVFCDGADTCGGGSCSVHAGSPCAGGPQCDVCDEAAGGCVVAAAGTACDDGVFCNGADTCDSAGNCTDHGGDPCPGTNCNTCHEAGRTCFDPAGTLCNDADPGTLQDICNGSGVCAGHTVTQNYAVLAWPPNTPGVAALVGTLADVTGDACAETIRVRHAGKILGDAVAYKNAGSAMNFGPLTRVSGNVVTGGGSISGQAHVTVGGSIDTGGSAAALAACTAGSAKAAQRHGDFGLLPSTQTLPAIVVPPNGTQSIPMGAGQNVIDVPSINVRPHGKLQLVGTSGTTKVIIRVSDRLRLQSNASVDLAGGLTPEQVLFVVDGPVTTRRYSHLAGSILGASTVTIGWNATADGQLVGGDDVRVLRAGSVTLHPFMGW